MKLGRLEHFVTGLKAWIVWVLEVLCIILAEVPLIRDFKIIQKLDSVFQESLIEWKILPSYPVVISNFLYAKQHEETRQTVVKFLYEDECWLSCDLRLIKVEVRNVIQVLNPAQKMKQATRNKSKRNSASQYEYQSFSSADSLSANSPKKHSEKATHSSEKGSSSQSKPLIRSSSVSSKDSRKTPSAWVNLVHANTYNIAN
eukprot:Filipodium_phascolosomae@DN1060_c0_g1_i1.p1